MTRRIELCFAMILLLEWITSTIITNATAGRPRGQLQTHAPSANPVRIIEFGRGAAIPPRLTTATPSVQNSIARDSIISFIDVLNSLRGMVIVVARLPQAMGLRDHFSHQEDRMSEVLRTHSADYQLVGPHEFVDSGSYLDFQDEFFAYGFLNKLAEDSFNLAAIRRIAWEYGLDMEPPTVTHADVLKCLATELIARRLRVLRTDAWWDRPGSSRKGDRPGDQPGKDEPPPPPASDEKTWINFEVLDDETEKPVSGVILHLQLTDGRIFKAKTNAAGMIEITDIPAGACGIEYMTDPDSLEVVSLA
jgi:hypothetical protein